MSRNTILVVLLAITAGIFCFAGNVHSQTYYDQYTCYSASGAYYESNVPCFNHGYDRAPIIEFDFGSRHHDLDQDHDDHRGYDHGEGRHERGYEGH
jgi:hypothetical protein